MRGREIGEGERERERERERESLSLKRDGGGLGERGGGGESQTEEFPSVIARHSISGGFVGKRPMAT